MTQMIKKYFDLFKFLQNKNDFYLLLLFSCSSALFSILPIIVLEKLINEATSQQSKHIEIVLQLGIIYLLIQILAATSKAMSNYLSEKMQKNICSEMQKAIFEKFCVVDFVDLRNNDTLMFTNSIVEDTTNIADNYMQPLSQLIIAIISFVLALMYMVHVDVLLTIVLFPLVLIATVSSRYIQQKLSNQIQIKREKNEKLWKLFSELLKGISSIRLLRRQAYFKQEINTSIDTAKKSGIEQAKIESMNLFVMIVLFMGTIGCILIVTSIFLVQNKITIGTLVAILMYNHMLVDPLLELIDIQTKVNKVYISICKLDLIFQMESEQTQHVIKSINKPKKLEVKDVVFQYPSQERSMYYNFKFDLNENYAIVGKTGIGKSTIAKLLSGLVRFEKGSIKYYDSNNYEITSPLIALHEQDGYIFDRSIKDNILFGNLNISESEYKQIVRTCCLQELAKNFGNKPVGENGSKLSGGERKRVLIARTLTYVEAEIFIFDELCSSLDTVTAHQILTNILEICSNKSLIFIEHNPIIKAYIDHIVPMDDQGIVYE